jgi:hypothetical protein
VLNTKAELNDFMVDAEDGQKFVYESKAYEVTGYDDYERIYRCLWVTDPSHGRAFLQISHAD